MKRDPKTYFRPAIRRLAPYRVTEVPKAIRLSHNELPEDFSPAMKQELMTEVKKLSLNRYPNVQPEPLRSKLAQGLKLKTENILVANGSNTLIEMITLASAFQDTVMAPEPSFGLYEYAARALENRFIPMSLEAPAFQLDGRRALADLKKYRPALVFVANPNAPTGGLLDLSLIENLIQKAPGLVVVDEAYSEFTGVSLVKKIKKYPNLIILRTFSKAFGLGGGRLGYMISHPGNVEEVGKMLPPYCVSTLSQAAALVALKHGAFYRKLIAKIKKERGRVYEALQQLPKVEVYPSDTNFLLFKVGNAKRCMKHLIAKGVILRDQSSHPRLQGCIRVTIGNRAENDAFLRAIRSY